MKKNIVIIGGSYGIGKEIATQLAETNNVILLSRSANDLPENTTHHTFDVTNDDITAIALPETIDGFVYCPGTINLKPFKRLKQTDFQEDFEINFLGLVKTVQALLPQLSKSEQASLLFFSTVAVRVGMPFHTSVAASKGAIEGFAKALAAEYAPKMRVNVIAPSLTDTPLAGRLLANEDKKEKMGNLNPLKRVGEAQDIAAYASFLLGEKSSWVTGQIIGVDGGMSTLNV